MGDVLSPLLLWMLLEGAKLPWGAVSALSSLVMCVGFKVSFLTFVKVLL